MGKLVAFGRTLRKEAILASENSGIGYVKNYTRNLHIKIETAQTSIPHTNNREHLARTAFRLMFCKLAGL